ncbi:N-acetylmuramoyl-L-alanine amidase [Bacillus amyloliquefaciens]|uniref:N-acetylmuramoyl-L-alanine amidase n=1 Tax=Bacillus amyloliquefaciens TaxID=1390 RepID=UPI0032DE39EA
MPTIILDPGHGGKDIGAAGNGLIEKKLALEFALNVELFLKKKRIPVYLTRKTDVFVSLDERTREANRIKGDLFVSFHHNAGGGTGFESYIYPGLKETITGEIQKRMHTDIMCFLKVKDRGQKEADFAVLRQTKMPAILLENLFLDSVDDASLLKKANFVDEMCHIVAESIADIAVHL